MTVMFSRSSVAARPRVKSGVDSFFSLAWTSPPASVLSSPGAFMVRSLVVAGLIPTHCNKTERVLVVWGFSCPTTRSKDARSCASGTAPRTSAKVATIELSLSRCYRRLCPTPPSSSAQSQGSGAAGDRGYFKFVLAIDLRHWSSKVRA
ncbi:hypothetical protein BDV95DRAFT_590328 [Massariosphaeria phaeospora]|uniref:Uncharacterized protein n=1 Tax=Massariosphaeria phaeospora TaxID=100035 RepID=A0A7C8IH00_9PLEO|nr:hypothetical protein BDV95DRAFT_590328 [Massariosphaeria phaeospora]